MTGVCRLSSSFIVGVAEAARTFAKEGEEAADVDSSYKQRAAGNSRHASPPRNFTPEPQKRTTVPDDSFFLTQVLVITLSRRVAIPTEKPPLQSLGLNNLRSKNITCVRIKTGVARLRKKTGGLYGEKNQ